MSIFDTVVAKKKWKFHGAQVRPLGDESRDRAYPSVGLTCEVQDGYKIEARWPQEFYSWMENPPPDGSLYTYQSFYHIYKELKLTMDEPDRHLTELNTLFPGKFPKQQAMNKKFKDGFAALRFVEHGDFLVSNPMLIQDPEIHGNQLHAVTFVIRLLGEPGKEAMIITGYWDDEYLGTGGWC